MKKWKWKFGNIGGASRVIITSGQDIAHLGELDPTMWTVLSCPVKGLEMDEKSLKYIDTDSDGKIRVNDIVATAKWVTGALVNPDLLLKGADNISLNEFNTENAEGQKLYASAKQILEYLGKEGENISLSDTSDSVAIFSKTKFNGDGIITPASAETAEDKAIIEASIAHIGSATDRSGEAGVNSEIIEAFYKAAEEYVSWDGAKVEAPYGDDTEKVLSSWTALDAKVRDFFLRSRLAAFSPDSTSALDVQTARIEAISPENLQGKKDEIASYPVARITGEAGISMDAQINPAWEKDFNIIKEIALPADVQILTEEIWDSIGESLSGYIAWKNAKVGVAVEGLGIEKIKEILSQNRKDSLLCLIEEDLKYKTEAEGIDQVDRFLHVLKDFYKLLKNFVTFEDFYTKDKNVNAIFQNGTLIIDQRACRLCMKVSDMAKHNASAPTSGMFLIYCDCTTKTNPAKCQIVAAVTGGEVGDLILGKNAVYYDNNGTEWDAVITKVIENPISVGQSFWSPYRRMAKVVENLISKSAADKDDKMLKEATAKINAAPAATQAPTGENGKTPVAPPFDIAKFAGIFAAIGMALGMLGTALVTLFKGFVTLSWWQMILVLLGIILVISGPAMILAWMKLRRRNIAPLLNANGWAVNAASKISIPFGATLTKTAKFPKIKGRDPFAKKRMPCWAKWLIAIGVILIAVAIVWLLGCLDCIGLPSPINFPSLLSPPAQIS